VKYLKSIALGLVGLILLVAIILLGPVLSLNLTILDSEFAREELAKLDKLQIFREYISDIPLDEIYAAVLEKTVDELKPWIEEKSAEIVEVVYDYIEQRRESVSFTMNLEPVKAGLIRNLKLEFRNSPPESYLMLSSSEKEQFLNNAEDLIKDIIPADYEINEELLGKDTMRAVEQAKTIRGHLVTAFYGLIGLACFMLLLKIVLLRRVKRILFFSGIILAVAGVIGTAAWFITSNSLIPGFDFAELVPEISSWIPGMIKDALLPWIIYSLALLGAGIAIFTGSFFIKQNTIAEGNRAD